MKSLSSFKPLSSSNDTGSVYAKHRIKLVTKIRHLTYQRPLEYGSHIFVEGVRFNKLKDVLDQAIALGGGMVVIEGPPGSGKRAMLQHYLTNTTHKPLVVPFDVASRLNMQPSVLDLSDFLRSLKCHSSANMVLGVLDELPLSALVEPNGYRMHPEIASSLSPCLRSLSRPIDKSNVVLVVNVTEGTLMERTVRNYLVDECHGTIVSFKPYPKTALCHMVFQLSNSISPNLFQQVSQELGISYNTKSKSITSKVEALLKKLDIDPNATGDARSFLEHFSARLSLPRCELGKRGQGDDASPVDHQLHVFGKILYNKRVINQATEYRCQPYTKGGMEPDWSLHLSLPTRRKREANREEESNQCVKRRKTTPMVAEDVSQDLFDLNFDEDPFSDLNDTHEFEGVRILPWSSDVGAVALSQLPSLPLATEPPRCPTCLSIRDTNTEMGAFGRITHGSSSSNGFCSWVSKKGDQVQHLPPFLHLYGGVWRPPPDTTIDRLLACNRLTGSDLYASFSPTLYANYVAFYGDIEDLSHMSDRFSSIGVMCSRILKTKGLDVSKDGLLNDLVFLLVGNLRMLNKHPRNPSCGKLYQFKKSEFKEAVAKRTTMTQAFNDMRLKSLGISYSDEGLLDGIQWGVKSNALRFPEVPKTPKEVVLIERPTTCSVYSQYQCITHQIEKRRLQEQSVPKSGIDNLALDYIEDSSD